MESAAPLHVPTLECMQPPDEVIEPRGHLSASEMVTADEAFAWQAARCRASGSPVAAALLHACAESAQQWQTACGLDSTVRFGDHIPLRVMAAVHYLAITRAAAPLGLFFPTLGGEAHADSPQFAELVAAALSENPDTVADFIARAPQTNEPGRQTPLACALQALNRNRPVDLVELGCSAGLNLGLEQPANAPRIVSRRGCDLNPIDAHSVEGRARLSAYVWVDDIERFRRLGRAIEQAQQQTIEVLACAAAEFVRDLRPHPEHTLLIWTSAFEPYLDAHAAAVLAQSIAQLATRMSEASTLVEASWEDAGDTSEPERAFALRLRTWAAGSVESERVIARGSAHGAHFAPVP